MKTPLPARPGSADWREKLAALRARKRQLRQVAEALGLDPDSPKGEVVYEFLLGEIFRQVLEEPGSSSALLRELQTLLKAGPPNPAGRKKMTPKHRKSLKHHLEQLYGPGVVVEELDEEDEQETSATKAG